MKNLIIFLSVLSFNFSISQTNAEQRAIDFLNRIEEKERMKSQEQFNLDLIIQLYDNVNNLQAIKKYHYENKNNKEYLKKYKRKLFYGLREERTWVKDEIIISKRLSESIALYREQYQRCILNYVWAKKFPRNISKEFDVNNLPY